MQQKAVPLGLLKISAIVVTVLFSIGTIPAGAWLGTDRPLPSVVIRVHQILPVLTLLPITGALYLLMRGRRATSFGAAWYDAYWENS